MEGDEKRTPGQMLDEALEDETLCRVKIELTYIKPKTKRPKPGKPTTETR